MKSSNLLRLMQAMEKFREYDPTMPIHIALTFVYVAANEGRTMEEISEVVGSSQPATSRNVSKILGDKHGLLDVRDDPSETRRKIVNLSRKGRSVAETLSTLMEK